MDKRINKLLSGSHIFTGDIRFKKKWKGYDVYVPTLKPSLEGTNIGYVQYILCNQSECRFCTTDESLEIISGRA